ncbi:MAG: hypothetical protein ABFS86_16860 [Planctomycetota bacterium]
MRSVIAFGRLVALTLVAASALILPGAARGKTAIRTADRIVVRGRTDLVGLLRDATRDAWREGREPRAVAIVVDVTPFTQLAAPQIRTALEKIGEEHLNLGGEWAIGALGRPMRKSVRHPSALVHQVSAVLESETRERLVFRALRRSLANFRDPGVVVYLADWRLEDDIGLEGFITELQRRKQSLSVIGTEGCFTRGWNEAFFPRHKADAAQKYEPGIGRHPFGRPDPEEPWHCGDTAWPHVPWHFRVPHFHTVFTTGHGRSGTEEEPFLDREEYAKPELLEARLRQVTGDVEGLGYPLASSFGPWPLMRACAQTGGKYFIFSFNPYGRTDVQYDFARCNHFAPDLRSRKEIFADARRRPLARGLMKAWEMLGNRKFEIAAITAPLTPTGSPLPMVEVNALHCMSCAWCKKEQHTHFLRVARENRENLVQVARVLDAALAAPRKADAVDRRYRADAEYLRHIVAIYRFEIGEAIAAAETVTPADWDDDRTFPGIVPKVWIRSGSDPDQVKTADDLGAQRGDAGREIAELRRAFLRRYGGTPFGELVGRNHVATWVLARYIRVEEDDGPYGPMSGGTPSESGTNRAPSPPPRTGPGSSSGGGATSGR